MAAHRRRNATRPRIGHFALCSVPDHDGAFGVTNKKAVLRLAGRLANEPRRVRVADQVVQIDPPCAQQFMHQSENEEPVRPRPDPQPLVGNRRIARPDRVYRNELGAAARLEPAERYLDRVGRVIFGNTEHQQIFGPFPVGLAELPERAANGVEAGGRHVDRTEPAMGRIVGRAELAGPVAG